MNKPPAEGQKLIYYLNRKERVWNNDTFLAVMFATNKQEVSCE